MAKDPDTPKGSVEKPLLDGPTPSNESVVVPQRKPALKTKLAKPTDMPLLKKKNTPSDKVEGMIIRGDSPIPKKTQSVQQETVGPEMQKDTNNPSDGPVQKSSDSLEATVSPPPGSAKAATTLGDFKLLKKLGQGGMGAVYKAHWISKNRIVAVKVLARELTNKEAYVLRFQREARAMQKADHPNILGCLEVGEAKGYHFIAMEFVEGGSIEAWLKKLGRFSIGDALHIVLKTAEGLQHAHEKSLIHRDIKPDNILLTKDGTVKVADLGLAKDTDDDQALTKTGTGAGTPIYMAPEQARDVKHVDARVDIYSLGVMMYVFLTGRLPFEGSTIVELTTAKEKGAFDPMRKYNDEVPSKLDLIVDKMLAKDPKHRFASCADIIAQLEPLGLANERLSFLDGDINSSNSTTNREPKPPTSDAPKAVAKPSVIKGPVSKVVAKSVAPKPNDKTSIQDDDEESQKDTWYWTFVTPEEKKVTKKVTTEQMRMLIKGGLLEPDAEVSKTMKGETRSVASYRDFQPLFVARETNMKANVKKGSKNKMEELAEEHDRRKKYAWISRSFDSIGGTIFGLLWIILILGIAGIGGYYAYVNFMLTVR